MSDVNAGAGAQSGADGQSEAALTLARANAKLAEIAAEKSLPEDAIVLFSDVIGLAARAASTAARADNHLTQLATSLTGEIDALSGRLTLSVETTAGALERAQAEIDALKSRPAPQINAAGVDLTPIGHTKTRLEALRNAGAIPGSIAELFEGVLAGFGVGEAPPAPTSNTDPTPAAEETQADAGAQAPAEAPQGEEQPAGQAG